MANNNLPPLALQQKNNVIAMWESKVHSKFQHVVHAVNSGSGVTIDINCYLIPDGSLVGTNFARNAPNRWQFKTNINGLTYRWGSHTIPFLNDPLLDSSGDPNTASHLCHNPKCHNPVHLCWESLDTNKGRNWCAGPNSFAGCPHLVSCIIQGPLYGGPGNTVAGHQTGNLFVI